MYTSDSKTFSFISAEHKNTLDRVIIESLMLMHTWMQVENLYMMYKNILLVGSKLMNPPHLLIESVVVDRVALPHQFLNYLRKMFPTNQQTFDLSNKSPSHVEQLVSNEIF